MDFAETWKIRKLSRGPRRSTALFDDLGFALVILSVTMKGLPNGQRPSWPFNGTDRYDEFSNGRYRYVTERPFKAV